MEKSQKHEVVAVNRQIIELVDNDRELRGECFQCARILGVSKSLYLYTLMKGDNLEATANNGLTRFSDTNGQQKLVRAC